MNIRSIRLAALLMLIALLAGCSRDGEPSKSPPPATTAPAQTAPVKIIRWGPQSTPARTIFNGQPDGTAAIWIEATGIAADPALRVLFGDSPLERVTVSSGLVTAAVPFAFYKEPGTREIVITESSGRITVVGVFEVLASPSAGAGAQSAGPASTAPLKIMRWGPQSTTVGVVVNPQPDGKAGIWIEVDGVSADKATRLLFGNVPLDNLTVTEKLVTAAIPAALMQRAGRHDVVIIEPSGRKTPVGSFAVEPAAEKAK